MTTTEVNYKLVHTLSAQLSTQAIQIQASLRPEINSLREEYTSLRNRVGQLLQLQARLPGETKQDSTPPAVPCYSYLSQKIILQFQPSIDPNDIPYEQIAWWKVIFSYIQPNDYERLHLRRLCNMFKASLKAPPKGIFTEYPHSNHTSMKSLMDRLNVVYKEDPTTAPVILFIREGVHEKDVAEVEEWGRELEEEEEEQDLKVTYPMKVIGAGRNRTILQGYRFKIQGTKEAGKKVDFKDLTVKATIRSGLFGDNGLDFLCDSITFTQCGGCGVYAENSKGRLINCVIIQCALSGIFCSDNALIELEGSSQTKVDGNVTRGDSDDYGLYNYDFTSRIHLLSPLTKESVSTNNHGGQNYSCEHRSSGTIQTVDSFESL